MDYKLTAAHNTGKKKWHITLEGEIDIFNAAQFRDELNLLCAQNKSCLVIDCAALAYIDSTGLGSLVAVLKTVRSYGGTITLANLRPSLQKLFRITNLDLSFIIGGDANV